MKTLASEPQQARVILLPGMGADARLFAPQRRALPNLTVPEWVESRRGESLAEYARRWAGSVRYEPPFFLGGVSFGGMVALEAARYLRPTAVFLIASCRSGSAVARRFAALEWVARALPAQLAARLRGPLAGYVSRLERLGPAHRRLLRALVADAPVPFLRWAVSAIRSWRFERGSVGLGIPVCQIHGQNDRLIPFVRSGADHVIPDGGHLINLTHADEVNQFILARLRSGGAH
jgi:pimeloyl-ACP methyl ester carboxylesterase